MRRMKLAANEMKAMYDCMNVGHPQTGLSVSEVRERMPIMDKLCEPPTKKRTISAPEGTREIIEFAPSEITLKESEYDMVLRVMESSAGWASVDATRPLVKLVDRMKEIPTEKEEQPTKE